MLFSLKIVCFTNEYRIYSKCRYKTITEVIFKKHKVWNIILLHGTGKKPFFKNKTYRSSRKFKLHDFLNQTPVWNFWNLLANGGIFYFIMFIV